MDENLSKLIQEAIDALALAQAQIESLIEAMRSQNIDLGPEYMRLEEEMRRIVDALTYMKHVAESQNGVSG